MKNSIRILMGLVTLLCIGLVVSALPPIDVPTVIGMARDNIIYMAAPVAIVSSNITPELIKDLQIKFGTIKIITVTVEPAVYDIDELTPKDKANLRLLGIDVSTLCNSELEMHDRLAQYIKLSKELREAKETDTDKKKIFDKIPLLEGSVIYAAEVYQFLVKRPDRSLVKMLLPMAEKGNIDGFADSAVKNLVVGGDVDKLDDGIVFMGVVAQLKGMIKPYQSFLSRA